MNGYALSDQINLNLILVAHLIWSADRRDWRLHGKDRVWPWRPLAPCEAAVSFGG
jgi:hypothetical protein